MADELRDFSVAGKMERLKELKDGSYARPHYDAAVSAQNAKYVESQGVTKSITASAVLFTPLTGHLYAEISAPADIYIRTDDTAVVLPADGDTSCPVYILAGQPKVVPVTAGVPIRARSVNGSAVLVSVVPMVEAS